MVDILKIYLIFGQVRARKELDDTSVWVLTNLGWVEEKPVGNVIKRKAIGINCDLSPCGVRVLKTKFLEAQPVKGLLTFCNIHEN